MLSQPSSLATLRNRPETVKNSLNRGNPQIFGTSCPGGLQSGNRPYASFFDRISKIARRVDEQNSLIQSILYILSKFLCLQIGLLNGFAANLCANKAFLYFTTSSDILSITRLFSFALFIRHNLTPFHLYASNLLYLGHFIRFIRRQKWSSRQWSFRH